MMIDAGDVDLPRKLPKLHERKGFEDLQIRPPFPHTNQTTGKWIVDYVNHFWPRPTEKRRALTYLLVTHFHSDHLGNIGPENPISRHGYKLTGVTEVAESFPIGTVVDRGYPDYDFPINLTEWQDLGNYRNFLASGHSGNVEKFIVGSQSQFHLKITPEAYETFRVHNVKSNLDVVGPNGEVVKIVGEVFQNPTRKKWDENEMSTAIRIDYGSFRYYEGGDQEAHENEHGSLDTITATAEAVGPVDVATANHHGRGTNQAFCDEIDPAVVILQGLFSDQPLVETMQFLTAPRISDGTSRVLLVTDIYEERLRAIGTYSKALAAMNGHVVVRVSKPGPTQSYHVFMLNAERRVKKKLGPFLPRRQRTS